MKTSPPRLLTNPSSLTDHESQQGTNWIGYPDVACGQLWLFSRDQPLNIFYISRNKNTVFVTNAAIFPREVSELWGTVVR
jgi:hypothetical protein